MNKIFVNQTSTNDCAAACLTMIYKIYNVKIDLATVKRRLKIDNEGTTLYDMVKLTKEIGINTSCYKDINIEDIKTPCIAHTINKEGKQHFVVIYKKTKKSLTVFDPSSNILNYSYEDFSKIYTKIVMYFDGNDNISFKKILNNNKLLILKLTLLTFSFTFFNLYFFFLASNYITSKYKNNMVLIFIIIGFFKELLDYFRKKMSYLFQKKIDKQTIFPIINKVIDLPHSYYKLNGSGALMSKLNDLSYIKDMYFKIVDTFLVNFIIVLISFCILFFTDFRFIFIDISFFLIYFLYNYLFYKKNSLLSKNYQEDCEVFSNTLVDSVNSIITIKNLKKEYYFNNKITNSYKMVIKSYDKLFKKYINYDFIVKVIEVIFILISIILIGVNNNANLLFLYIIQMQVITSFYNILSLNKIYLDYKNSRKRIKEIDSFSNCEFCEKIDFKNILFKNFYFKYDNVVILKNINLYINKTDFIMINGKSGCGKSTMFKILSKEIPYYGNNIKINNKYLKDFSYDSIKELICYVDQKTKLINGSIKENIFFDGKIDNKVLKTSNVDNILSKMNITLDYVIDNINSNLSHGQMSKIMIAQALNSNKDIIIFDETTVSLDILEERKILKNIKKFYNNKTIILITHRMSNIDLFNKVIKL